MEDIDKAISTLQELIGCTNLDQVQKLIRKFEDLVGPTEKTNLNYESMSSIDQLKEQTKAFALKVEKLSGRGMFPEGIALDVVEEERGDILPTSKLAGETTAIRNMEKIYDFIIGDVKKIGVWGMGGIGKTTIMKHINNRILNEQKEKFDCVIWVTVSNDSSVFKLQDDIASKLDVNLSKYKDTTTRSGVLLKAFKKKGRYLLILDDLWEGYPLEDVGIPDPNDPTFSNGCKLVLTTRLHRVCQSMKCEAIKMDLLSEEEAWSLFLDHVGRDVLQVKGLEPIVKDVASECARLPLAIFTIARSMRGENETCEWSDALEKLRAFSKESGDKGEKVIEQLKFSYDRLKSKKLQKCLLFCALYPEDKQIDRRELVELLALEGIIEKKKYKRDEINEGNTMLNNLINQCLLEGGTYSRGSCWVKMHDLVRDMVLQIDDLYSQYLTVSGIKLSDVKWSKNLLKIHISRCDSSNVSPMCPRLTTFILEEYCLTNIPDSFFHRFKALKVLNLSGCVSLQVLPKSISDLVNLVGLLLRDCSKLAYVPPLAKLKDLQTLDFGLNMEHPYKDFWKRKDFMIKGVEKLSNLRYVNLFVCLIEVFPSGIIPRLSNLQCLVCSPFTKVTASELIGLKKLEIFKGAFHDIDDLCVYAKHMEQKKSQLISYVFFVNLTFAEYDKFDEAYMDNSVVKFVKLAYFHLESNEYRLPKDVQRLEIKSVCDLSSLCALVSLYSATDLQTCTIWDCNGLKELVSTSSSSSFVLPRLDSLKLFNLKNLESLIGRKKKACNVFPCLRELHIWGCNRMKVVINIELLSNLNNLEILDVQCCKELEEIIEESLDDEKDVNEGITEITRPKLSILRLQRLPHLISICPASRPLICKSLESFNVFPCLQQLEIYYCPKMKVVFNIGLLSNLNNLEKLDVHYCEELEEIIGERVDDEKDVNDGTTQITLPKLKHLALRGLPHLRSICPVSRPLICKSLEDIYIEGCDRMKVVINIGLLSNLNNLKLLFVRDCKELEEIIGEWLGDEKDINAGMTEITLPKLSNLRLWSLPHLRYICPASRPLICKSLQYLDVSSCPKMKMVFNIGLLSNLNNLEILGVQDCKELEEIIGEWEEDEKDVNEGMTQITLPNLWRLELNKLPHLRSIFPASRPLICKSLKQIGIGECPELEQCVFVAWDERGRPSSSASLQPIELKSLMRE